jgi:Icc-related predicted phosphoesterase
MHPASSNATVEVARLPVKLQILSDLHLEFGPQALPNAGADIVVLAGDIGRGVRGVEWAAEAFTDQTVIYVAGNHEFYKQRWERLVDQCKEAAVGTNVRVLEDDSTVVTGIRIIGATLWTDFILFGDETRSEAMREAKARMNDYKHVTAVQAQLASGYKESRAVSSLRPAHTALRHAKSRDFIETALSEPFDGPTVVVTHHLPHMNSVPARYAEHIGSAAYASNLQDLIERFQPDLWIHGHSHNSADYKVGNTRVMSNPRGYPQPHGVPENPVFNPTLVVEISGGRTDGQKQSLPYAGSDQ